MVNQTFLAADCLAIVDRIGVSLPVFRVSTGSCRTHLLLGILITPRSNWGSMNLFDCAGVHIVWFSRGAKGRLR